jgi:hypothetical protein
MLFYTYYYTCRRILTCNVKFYVFMLKHRSEICCLEIYAKMGNLKEKYVSLKSIRLYSSGWGHQTKAAYFTSMLQHKNIKYYHSSNLLQKVRTIPSSNDACQEPRGPIFTNRMMQHCSFFGILKALESLETFRFGLVV